jgi:hypothetical protein
LRTPNKTTIAGLLLAGCLTSFPADAGVADLSWMTGSWAGPMGPDATLEENWMRPVDGTIGAFVRARGAGATSMIELIVVEEVGDTLVLHIQQWDPGFKPRPGGPQRMELAAMGENTVTFEATSEGGLASLTYSRPDDDTFTVNVELADGRKIPMVLHAQ